MKPAEDDRIAHMKSEDDRIADMRPVMDEHIADVKLEDTRIADMQPTGNSTAACRQIRWDLLLAVAQDTSNADTQKLQAVLDALDVVPDTIREIDDMIQKQNNYFQHLQK